VNDARLVKAATQ